MVFAIGLSSGVIENFAYKRLRELGGTGSVLGVSRLVSSLSGIPMFFFSGVIVKHFSIVGILTASMMSFIARWVELEDSSSCGRQGFTCFPGQGGGEGGLFHVWL